MKTLCVFKPPCRLNVETKPQDYYNLKVFYHFIAPHYVEIIGVKVNYYSIGLLLVHEPIIRFWNQGKVQSFVFSREFQCTLLGA